MLMITEEQYKRVVGTIGGTTKTTEMHFDASGQIYATKVVGKEGRVTYYAKSSSLEDSSYSGIDQ